MIKCQNSTSRAYWFEIQLIEQTQFRLCRKCRQEHWHVMFSISVKKWHFCNINYSSIWAQFVVAILMAWGHVKLDLSSQDSLEGFLYLNQDSVVRYVAKDICCIVYTQFWLVPYLHMVLCSKLVWVLYPYIITHHFDIPFI